MYKLDETRIENAKHELEKAYYEVINVNKKAYITEDDSYIGFDTLKDDILFNVNQFDFDIIMIEHGNSREYQNIFKNYETKDLDFKRLGLTSKEIEVAESWGWNLEGGKIVIENYEDEKLAQKIEDKINKKINVETIEARGWSQGDWDSHTFVYYKDIKGEDEFLASINDLEYIFTVTSFDVRLVDVETRRYKNGEMEDVEVEVDSCLEVCNDGFYDTRDLEAKGYEIITK